MSVAVISGAWEGGLGGACSATSSAAAAMCSPTATAKPVPLHSSVDPPTVPATFCLLR